MHGKLKDKSVYSWPLFKVETVCVVVQRLTSESLACFTGCNVGCAEYRLLESNCFDCALLRCQWRSGRNDHHDSYYKQYANCLGRYRYQC